jgi:hypothetical protein
MTIDDETLMAYADHELDAAAAAAVDSAVAADPQLEQRLRRLQRQRALLSAAFGRVLDEPVPPELVAAASGARRIVPMRHWGWPEFAAMAASLVGGVLVTWLAVRATGEPLLHATRDGLVASGGLARALSDRLAGEPVDEGVRIGLSFRDVEGGYCRAFVVERPGRIAGLACRAADAWQVKLLTESAPGDDRSAYRMAASGLPEDVLRAVDRRIAGEPLDAAGEAAARSRGWREQTAR